MDFDSIEGLSDEEIESIYGTVNNNEDDVLIGGCFCYTGSKYMHFGIHKLDIYFDCAQGHHCGYCALQLKTIESCQSWCQKHCFTLKSNLF